MHGNMDTVPACRVYLQHKDKQLTLPRLFVLPTPGTTPSTSLAQDVTAVLQQQLQHVRQAAVRRSVEEVIYLWACQRLASGEVTLPGLVAAHQKGQVHYTL